MKKTLLFMMLSSFLFFSCEKEEQLFEDILQESSNRGTRSFDHYISGPTTVNAGESYYYYLEGMSYCENSYWSCINGEVLSFRDNNALIYFENPGSSQVIVHSTETDNYTRITESLKVTVLPFDNASFLNNISIIGDTETEIGKQVNYRIYTSYRNYILNEISWKLDGDVISLNQSFNHIFHKSGYYKLKCTGSFSNVAGGTSVSFEKEIEVCVKTETGEYPDYTLDDIFCPMNISNFGRTATVYLHFMPKNAIVTFECLNFKAYGYVERNYYIRFTNMHLTDTSTIKIYITLGGEQRVITHPVKYSGNRPVSRPRS